jgi:acetolactate synthase-1/2/3 large subunit
MDDRTAPTGKPGKPGKRNTGDRHATRPPSAAGQAAARATAATQPPDPDNWTVVPAEERGDAIVAAMGLGGVDYLFFNSGSEIMFMQEAVAKANALGTPAPKLIMMTHEYPTLNAALGYAAATGRMAATAVHVDVGTQHYGCAIHTARHSGLPVLVTAGAPPASYPGSMRGARDGSHFWVQQTADQAGIVRQYMKWDHRLEYQDNPGMVVSRALQIAQSEPRGPVYLVLPREIAFLPSNGERFPTAQQLGIARVPAPDPDAVRELAERLVKARNPAIVVQRSGRNVATVPALVGLAEFLGAPVGEAAARSYQCFPMDHPLYQSINLDLTKADVVLVIETDVPWIPGPKQPGRDAFIAVVDIDPVKAHIATYEFTANLRLLADTEIALHELRREVEKLAGAGDRTRFKERAARWAEVSRERFEQSRKLAQAAAKQSPISPLWLSYQIGEAMDDNCLMVDETLMLSPLPPYLRFSEPGTYFRNPGSGGGWCAGAALGAKLGRPDKDVVAVSGDGFYMYAVANAAIASAVRYRAPFMSVIYQNRSYSTGTAATAQYYPKGYAVQGGLEAGYFDPPIDFAREAEAAGAYGENVKDPAEVGPALQRGLKQIRNGTPAVIAVWLPKVLQDT